MLKKIVIFVCLLTSLFAKGPLDNDENDICTIAINALLNSNTDLNPENYQTYEWFAKQFHGEEFDKVKYDEFGKYALYDKLKQEVPDVRKFLKEKYGDMFGVGIFTYADVDGEFISYSTSKARLNEKTYNFEKNAFILELASPGDYRQLSFTNGEQCSAVIKLSFDNAPILLSLSMDRNEANKLLKFITFDRDRNMHGRIVYFIEYKVNGSKLDKIHQDSTIYTTVNADIFRVTLLLVTYDNDDMIVDIKTIANWDIK